MADMVYLLVQGPQAHLAGVVFPKEQSALDRTLLVGNLNPSVSDEQVRTTAPLTCSEVMVSLRVAAFASGSSLKITTLTGK